MNHALIPLTCTITIKLFIHGGLYTITQAWRAHPSPQQLDNLQIFAKIAEDFVTE